MESFYAFAALPAHSDLPEKIDQAAGKLADKLLRLDLDALDLTPSTRRAMEEVRADVRGSMQLYTYLLALSLADAARPLDQMVFVDFGGGAGLLALLARELSVGTVIYIDPLEICQHDAMAIGRALGLEAKTYLSGDLDDLVKFLDDRFLLVDAFASYGSIDRMYRAGVFLRRLRRMAGGTLKLVLASPANPYNPVVRKRWIRIHRKLEADGTGDEDAFMPGETPQGYRDLRKEIIRAAAPGLLPASVEALADQTRGLRDEDIRRCVSEFQQNGTVPYAPGHPTNTCHPKTGRWAGRLMDIAFLRDLLAGQGYDVRVLGGLYRTYPGVSWLWLRKATNRLLSHLGGGGLVIAPYYVIEARRKPSFPTPRKR